ncbi:MAG: LacI family DNA-binding transcriptional regulator [Bacteroidales bacterium]|nr:LacI family DNA-binding transcriptional regulator [Bacteroidales bacterium]
MVKPVTIKDIAREAGVSTALVSFVMTNYLGGKMVYKVNDETSRRVLEVADRLNYKPNTSARALRSGRTNTIGVVVSDIANPFFAEIARYLEDQAYQYNYNVIFGSSDENPDKLRRVAQVLLDKGVDGLIIVPCAGSEDTICTARWK